MYLEFLNRFHYPHRYDKDSSSSSSTSKTLINHQIIDILPNLPGKKWMNFDSNMLNKRQEHLDIFLRDLLKYYYIKTNENVPIPFRTFLTKTIDRPQ